MIPYYAPGSILRVKEPGMGSLSATRTAIVVADDGTDMIKVQLRRSRVGRHHSKWAPMAIKIRRATVIGVIVERKNP